jgi:L-asparaginase
MHNVRRQDDPTTEDALTAQPRVAVLSLGGTIAMVSKPGEGGLRPSLSAADLVAAVPQLANVADVVAEPVVGLPGASLTFDHIRQVARAAERAVDAGAAGVVVTQGTDTIEETAYLLDLWWSRPQPLVVTGAMRGASEAGADGPANVLAAVTAGCDQAMVGVGVTVVMAGEIHAARHVRKTHSSRPGAFTSPNLGPVGHIREGRAQLTATLMRHRALPLPTTAPPTGAPRIAVVESVLCDDGDLLRLIEGAGYDGVVLAAFGVGHVSDAVAAHVSRLAERMVVVFASRTGAGSTFEGTYGFSGSESDLIARGAQPAGFLDHRKARLLLWALLAAGAGRDDITREFSARGRG